MIQKHAIPILEFDDNPQAVIMPDHEGLDLHLPKKCVYAFLGEEIDRYAREVGADCELANSFLPTKNLSSLCSQLQGRGDLSGSGSCWFRSSSPVYGLVDWIWVWSRLFPLEPVVCWLI